MPEHRAEAERWLREAEAIWDEPRDYDDPPIDQLRIISRALISTSHALLAFGQEYRVTPPRPEDVGTTTWHDPESTQ